MNHSLHTSITILAGNVVIIGLQAVGVGVIIGM